ncbi:hypothetical protein BWI17_08115 [Betaproteobacteria bacterium GR16-43]|nr:hypothetical protein BWI17_08115 [Betaproteobacteria bacterium GR16-43]
MIRHLTALLLAALAGTVLAAGEAPLVVHGEVVVGEKARPVAQLRLGDAATVPVAILAPLQDSEIEPLRKANRKSSAKRLMIGVNRTVESMVGPKAARSAWQPVDGGHAARFSVSSPDAAAVRLAIDLTGTPTDVEMVFLGSAGTELFGPVRVGSIVDRTGPWWSPPTEGATQTVEVFVPAGIDPASVSMRFTRVSHLFTSAGSGFRKRAVDIGDAGSCNKDIACAINPSAAFLTARNATAQMVFNVGAGVGLCTGTLMNDTDTSTQTPWFYSANHCFENEDPPYRTPTQMQVIANTLTTYWFFEAASCGSLATPPIVTRTGGATLVFNSQPRDVLFLRLNDTPPAGATLIGFDANPFVVNETGTDFHHPQGDLKKFSQGSVVGFSTPFTGAVANGYTEIRWTTGTTEGGSSGSGLLAFSGSEYLLRGGLWGGSALCTNPNGTDNFSRFDLVYPQLAPYLGYVPFANFTDLWWGGESQSGWGLNLTQHASNIIFGVWYTYDAAGKRQWIVMPGGQWTSSSTFTGALYITSGPPYNAPFNTANFHITPVGTGTLTFSNANTGTFAFTVNGVSGTKSIVRQPY